MHENNYDEDDLVSIISGLSGTINEVNKAENKLLIFDNLKT